MGSYKNIAISGDIGTGKSTLARRLAENLGWEHLSGGEHIRKWYQENGVEIVKTDEVPEQIDRDLEGDFQKKMKEGRSIIFESRLAGWLARDMGDVLKVLCVTDFDEAMRRVAKREGVSIEEASGEAKVRAKGLMNKFKRLYGVEDYLDIKYFDLVIDTTNTGPDEALKIVLKKMEND